MTSRGSQIGPYEITREIGRGGMGVVYLARDTNLDRDVAIKCLPEDFVDDQERLSRFQREAKSLASLNHPNIAAIYGLEEVDSKQYLILEYVPGETLNQVLDHGPMPVSEALPIAKQVAEAIEAAHANGIIHRDLKPANIKFAADDQIKVLDFGLAKAFDETPSSASEIATSPTYIPTNTPTMPGVVLGTAGYLSPEQARGRVVDKRTDIFSFGCVLYEMLAGKTIFPGETVTDSLGATLHVEPDWELLPPETPPTIRLLLRRCLTKDRKRRLQDIGDARIELEEAISDPTSSSLNLASAAIQAFGGKARSRHLRLKVVGSFVLGAVLTTAGAIGLSQLLKPIPVSPPVDRLSIVVPHRVGPFGRLLAASPDGRMLAYQGIDDDGRRLFLRPLGHAVVDPLEGTERSFVFAFSPDSKWIAFFQGQTLKKISIQGGPPTTLCETGVYCRGLDWADDGSIYYCAWSEDSIYRVSENGGKPELLMSLDDSESRYVAVIEALPGANAILFSSMSGMAGGNPAIEVYSKKDGSIKRVVDDAIQPVYASSGHLLFVRDATVMAAPFDIEALELIGPAVPVLEDVSAIPRLGGAHFTLAENGTLFHLTGNLDAEDRELITIDMSGKRLSLTTWTKRFREAWSSPDGSRIAAELRLDSDTELTRDIWILDLKKDIPTLLTTEDGLHADPLWSPDGQWIYYVTVDPDSFEVVGLFRRQSDGGGDAQLVYELSGRGRLMSISPDGDSILTEIYSSGPNDKTTTAGGTDIMLIDISGEEARFESWLATSTDETDPAISPNGRWVAYTSRETGNNQIYVRSFAGGGKYRVSRNRGRDPFWSPDGSTLYYVVRNQATGTQTVMSSVVTSGNEQDSAASDTQFEAEVPLEMFEMPPDVRDLTIFPDGKRFLAIAPPIDEEESADNLEIHVTLNFLEELKRLAPTGKD